MRRPSTRRDIQGVRALAIVAVVAEHAFGSPIGGFLGVDVFFVISGFLITGLVLREQAAVGRVHLGRFWIRRTLRLAPAFLVVAATSIALIAMLVPGRLVTDVKAAAAGSVSLANWYAIFQNGDYFAAQGPATAFDHLWSLSVEEQFYLVWPAVVAGVGFAVAKRWSGTRQADRTRRAVLGIVLLAGVIASLAYALWMTQTAPQASYYSTMTRVWELAAGALVAVATPRARFSRRTSLWFGRIGLLMVVLSVVCVSPTFGAPAPAAIGAVVGTLMILIGGLRADAQLRALRTPITDWIASISYSLYLWHLPLLVLARIIVPGAVWVAVPVAVLLAHATFVFVEEPFRRLGGRHRTRAQRRRAQRLAPAMGATVAAVIMSVGIVTVSPAPTAPRVGPAVSNDPLARAVEERVGASLRTTSWPAGFAAEVVVPSDSPRACAVREDRPTLEACTFGPEDAEHVAVVLGDSMASAWLDALIPWMAAEHDDWQLVALPVNGCPMVDLDWKERLPGCAEVERTNLDLVASIRPDVIFVTTRLEGAFDLAGGGTASPNDLRAGFERSFAGVGEHTGAIVHIAPPPWGKDLATCASQLGSPVSCINRVSATWTSNARLLEEVAHDRGDVFIETADLVAREGLTPAIIDGQPMRIDAAHITPTFATSLAPALGSAIDRAGVMED